MKIGTKTNLKSSLVFIFVLLFAAHFLVPFLNVYADDLYTLFGNESYKTYRTIDELSSRMLSASNKHQLKYFAILSKWETYPVNDQERIQDVSGYVDTAVEDLKFILEYDDTEVGKLFVRQYKNYEKELKEVKKNPDLFFDNKVIFFNYAMNNPELAAWYDYYTLFKENTLQPFANQYIYTNSTRISVNKVREGNAEEKKEGIRELKELIAILEKYQKSDNTPNILKGYCKEIINHFNRVIEGKDSDISALVKGDRYWLEGLIPVGQEFDKMSEYNFYVIKFNQFADFPTLELSRKLKAKDLNRFITMLQSVPATSQEVIELKKKHYDLIYALANEKNNGDIPVSAEKAYADFIEYHKYMDSYFRKVQQQYGTGFNSEKVVAEIENFKSRLSCLDTKIDDFYTTIAYKPVYVEDTTEYRNLATKDPVEFGKIVPGVIIGLFLLVAGFVVYKVVKNNLQNRDNDGDFYDGYY